MTAGGDEREVKRQRRKQSNRESARRSRLRKQSECEDLHGRVQRLVNENAQLGTELDDLRVRYKALCREHEKLTGVAMPALPKSTYKRGGDVSGTGDSAMEADDAEELEAA